MYKMAILLSILLCSFVLQTSSKAATSDSHPIITKSIEEGPELDSIPKHVADQSIIENSKDSNQRQKRFYDYIGFGYSQPAFPANFPFLPHFSKRDESQNIGSYSPEDSLHRILRRLQSIASNTRQIAQTTPQQASIPAFIPFLYVPPIGCGCTTPSQAPTQPAGDRPQSNQNSTVPDLTDRVNLDDTRRNWGQVLKDDTSNVDDNDDGNRPISFDPVIPQEPIDVAMPPVEHGSVQAGAQQKPISTTTFRPIADRPTTNIALVARYPQSEVTELSNCDKAFLSCCFRVQSTPNCFAQQDCPDPSVYGEPCNPKVVLNILKRTQLYYEKTWFN